MHHRTFAILCDRHGAVMGYERAEGNEFFVLFATFDKMAA